MRQAGCKPGHGETMRYSCQCNYTAFNHAAGQCAGNGGICVERDGKRIRVCDDCQLNDDITISKPTPKPRLHFEDLTRKAVREWTQRLQAEQGMDRREAQLEVLAEINRQGR